MDTSTATHFSFPCHDVVNVVEFSPLESCSSLIAVGTKSRVSVYHCTFESESYEGASFYWRRREPGYKCTWGETTVHPQFDSDVKVAEDDLKCQPICDFQSGCLVTALAWCPSSCFRFPEEKDHLRLAAAGRDNIIRCFTSDLSQDSEIDPLQEFKGHTDFINSVVFNPENTELLVSTGDDHTCRFWGGDGSQQACFTLDAPGMSVCTHENEPEKVMVAQKNGVIKIFSLDLQQQIMSFDCGVTPLMAADWCKHNDDIIAAVAGTEWFMFQPSRSSQPVERRQAHTDGVRIVRWARNQPTLLGTMGRPGVQIKVFSTRHHQVPLNTTLQVAYGMSWHATLPVLAVGGDQMVHLYYIEPASLQAV